MYIDRRDIAEYPYDGAFYTYVIDESLPLDEREEVEVMVYSTKCDIQESLRTNTGPVRETFAIYFPFDEREEFPIRDGLFFRGDMLGIEVSGIVRGVFPTQMEGALVYITDRDA